MAARMLIGLEIAQRLIKARKVAKIAGEPSRLQLIENALCHVGKHLEADLEAGLDGRNSEELWQWRR